MVRAVRIVCVYSLLMALPVSAAQPMMRPGLWEITMVTESPSPGTPTTIVACLTKQDIKHMDVPKGKPTDDCQASGTGTGTSLTYSVKCAKRPRESTSSFTFTADTYRGVVTITEGSVVVRQVHSGRRVGDCAVEEEGGRP